MIESNNEKPTLKDIGHYVTVEDRQEVVIDEGLAARAVFAKKFEHVVCMGTTRMGKSVAINPFAEKPQMENIPNEK